MNLDDMIMASVCPQTIAGWLWYCDEHDTHGNADSEHEARAMGQAHSDYHRPDTADDCEITVWQRAKQTAV